MKKGLIVLTLLLTLGMSVSTQAQKHRHTPRGTELVDTTKQNSAIDAFSDTTSVDSVFDASNTNSVNFQWDSDNDEDVEKAFSYLDTFFEKHPWLAWILAVIIIVFVFLLVFSPIIIIVLLIYFVNRNRKQKIKMTQMAMENGQPIPNQVMQPSEDEVSDEYQKGLRQCFVGIGLAIFLGLVAEEVGFGIGALVFFIGLGKVIAAKTATKKQAKEDDLNFNHDNNNELKSQDYD